MSNEPTASNSISELEKLDLERRRLEVEKLRAEIGQVSLSWWKRPGYIGGLAPIVLALVGFFSAWSTGYFDTLRQNLENEIKSLTIERDQLNNANDDIQLGIDDAYLRVKGAIGETVYTLGHFRVFSLPQDARIKVEAALDNFEPDVAQSLKEIIYRYKSTEDIVKITEIDIRNLEDTLQRIPASKWATELVYTLGPLPGQVFTAPDGRLYNIEDRRYYDKYDDIQKNHEQGTPD